MCVECWWDEVDTSKRIWLHTVRGMHIYAKGSPATLQHSYKKLKPNLNLRSCLSECLEVSLPLSHNTSLLPTSIFSLFPSCKTATENQLSSDSFIIAKYLCFGFNTFQAEHLRFTQPVLSIDICHPSSLLLRWQAS